MIESYTPTAFVTVLYIWQSCPVMAHCTVEKNTVSKFIHKTVSVPNGYQLSHLSLVLSSLSVYLLWPVFPNCRNGCGEGGGQIIRERKKTSANNKCKNKYFLVNTYIKNNV